MPYPDLFVAYSSSKPFGSSDEDDEYEPDADRDVSDRDGVKKRE